MDSLNALLNYTPLHIPQVGLLSNSAQQITSHLAQFLELMKQVVGNNSCYASSEILLNSPDRPGISEREQVSFPSSVLGLHDTEINDNEGWTSTLDLDFV